MVRGREPHAPVGAQHGARVANVEHVVPVGRYDAPRATVKVQQKLRRQQGEGKNGRGQWHVVVEVVVVVVVEIMVASGDRRW